MKIFMLAAFALLSSGAMAENTRDFSLDVPAEDIKQLDLEGNVGSIDIRAADVDAVEVRVRLEPSDDDWFGSEKKLAERLEEAKLEHDVDGDVLRVRLNYEESRHDDGDLEEHWEIRVPTRMALNVELNVGEMSLVGTGGGVEAEVNVGELEIDVTGGDIDAEVNVGEVDIRSATKTPGEFDLESNIGDARLRIDGRDTGRGEGWLGAGITHDAGGEDDVTATVNVGEVRVEIR